MDRFAHTRPSPLRALAVTASCLVLWIGPLVALWTTLGAGHVFTQEGVFFSKMAVVTFVGAYAVLAYVAQQEVETYQLLAHGQIGRAHVCTPVTNAHIIFQSLLQ